MRFHATFVHTPENCPLSHTGERPVPDWPAIAQEADVNLVSAVVNGPAHAMFFVVEADDAAKLNQLFRPLLGFAKGEILPVTDLVNR